MLVSEAQVMKKIIVGLALPCLFLAQSVCAQPDRDGAKVCAASLQPRARLVFDAVLENPQPGQTLRAALEDKVRELVFMDRLVRDAARPAAEAASQCLRIARGCTGDAC
jgi:hypothetical protein